MARRSIVDNYIIRKKSVDVLEVIRLYAPQLTRLSRRSGETAPPDGPWAGPWEKWSGRRWAEAVRAALLRRFFPENFDGSEPPAVPALALDRCVGVLNGLFAREREETPFDPLRDFALVSGDEQRQSAAPEEYAAFRRTFVDDGMYAFMRLSDALLPYRTLSHIAGVHFVAMYMARQLALAGVRVDLGIMSAAAAAHDLGKYGCRPGEMSRVPYLHYYYAYQLAERRGFPLIGSLASNHSVWDLELENLSVENLLLIYADFRVKSVRDSRGREKVRFFTLADSYQVILDKLDNVDEKKRRRYARVYARLRDFEELMEELGCSTDLKSPMGEPMQRPFAALAGPEELVRRFKDLAIRSNLQVMCDTSYEARFISLMEDIRSEKDWRHVRAFLTAIGEYSAYLPQSQKERILGFLFEMLSHRDGDIRRQAGRIAAQLIAGYEIEFSKEIPKGFDAPSAGARMDEVWRSFLDRALSPGRAVQERQRRWIGYAMKTVLSTLLSLVPDARRGAVLDIYVSRLKDAPGPDPLRDFILIDGAGEISPDVCTPGQQAGIIGCAERLARARTGETRAAALRLILMWLRQGYRPVRSMADMMDDIMPDYDPEPFCLQYMGARIREFYGIGNAEGLASYSFPALYLENQRADVPWIYKYLNLEILARKQAENGDTDQLYQYASHLLHLLRFTSRVVNRLQAGEGLAAVMPRLMPEQRYEIILEMVRALESGGSMASRYIPQYLGRFWALLGETEKEQFFKELETLAEGHGTRVVIAALETVTVILQESIRDGRRADMLRAEGLMCSSMAHYDAEIAQEAFYLIGHHIFGNAELTRADKKLFFSDIARRVLTLMDWSDTGYYVYFTAAALNHIYRFLSDCILEEGDVPFAEEERPAAFFPGTFDPFSLGHKEIVREICRMGYRVYLSLDEFSWSKRTQPFEVRRKILAMSTADMKDVVLFPEEVPVNIASPADIRRLRELFGGREIYMVVGSDVVEGASAYRRPAGKDSVRRMPHIVFARNEGTEDGVDVGRMARRISGRIVPMQLPGYLENVSSSQVRANVNAGKEISSLVDTLAENYIYGTGLYTMEPAYKKEARFSPVDVEHVPGGVVLRTPDERDGGPARPTGRDADGSGEDVRICGRVEWRELRDSCLMDACGSLALAERLRERVRGRCAMITALSGEVTEEDDKRLTAMNEALTALQADDIGFAVCIDPDPDTEDALRLFGFLPLDGEEGSRCFLIDLRSPMVLFYDTPASVKEPFSGNAAVRRTIRSCHLRLRRVLTELYPGQAVLCFVSEELNYHMVRELTRENGVPMTSQRRPGGGKLLGPRMCVPFGKMLKGVLIPNTVTKELDTEKVYSPDLSRFTISEFPGYAPLAIQIRAIRSFGRPVTLVDDLYHRGYRMEEIAAHLEREGIKDVRLLVGVASGCGRDLARLKGIDMTSVYDVPNMKTWMIEADMYPFLGGDEVSRSAEGGGRGPSVALPSFNMILPYVVPSFLRGASMDAVYHLSEVCLENAREICLTLEKEYGALYGRKLTLERIGEVVAEPRYPDSAGAGLSGAGSSDAVDELLTMAPSQILAGELQRLRRLRRLADPQYTI